MTVGDGGRNYRERQYRRYMENEEEKRKSKMKNDNYRNREQHLKEKDMLKMRQNKNKKKRNKKKARKKKFKTGNNGNSVDKMDGNDRSTFLYGNNNDLNVNNEKYFESVVIRKKDIQYRKDMMKSDNGNKNGNGNGKRKINYVHASNQEELNEISAKMMRAKLMGNKELAKELQDKLDSVREQGNVINEEIKDNMDNMDNNDEVKPFVFGLKSGDKSDSKKMDNNVDVITNAKLIKKLNNYEEMKRINDNDDVQTLLRKELNRDVNDFNYDLIKNKKLWNKMKTENDEQFESVNNDVINKNDSKILGKRKLKNQQNNDNRKRAKIINQHNSMNKILDNCPYCIENETIHNNTLSKMVLYYGKYFYVMLTKYKPICSYKLLIIPNKHLINIRNGLINNKFINEELGGASKFENFEFENELISIKKCIINLYKKEFNQETIFIETFRNANKKYHCYIECFPIDSDVYPDLMITFEHEIKNCDTQYAMNKKLIKLDIKHKLNNSIPINMPYFCVYFGLNNGFAHIIEDETKVNQHFGRSIIAGFIGEVLFKQKDESLFNQQKRFNEFKPFWVKYGIKASTQANINTNE